MTANSYSLHTAVAQMKMKLISILVEGGVYINTQSCDGKTPLMIACCFLQDDDEDGKRDNIIKLLLLYKADPNIQDILGRTALMYSFRHLLSPSIIKIMLENGAEPYITDVTERDAFGFIRTKMWPRYLSTLRPYIKAKVRDDLSQKSDYKQIATYDRRQIQFKQNTRRTSSYIGLTQLEAKDQVFDAEKRERRKTVEMFTDVGTSTYTDSLYYDKKESMQNSVCFSNNNQYNSDCHWRRISNTESDADKINIDTTNRPSQMHPYSLDPLERYWRKHSENESTILENKVEGKVRSISLDHDPPVRCMRKYSVNKFTGIDRENGGRHQTRSATHI